MRQELGFIDVPFCKVMRQGRVQIIMICFADWPHIASLQPHNIYLRIRTSILIIARLETLELTPQS